MKVYIAGPMSGVREYNYPLFFHVEQTLLAKAEENDVDLRVVNPARHDGETLEDAIAGIVESNRSWHSYLREAITALMECDSIVLLPGWEGSKGATLEAHIARELDFTVYHWNSDRNDAFTEPAAQPESVAAEADRLVVNERMVSYGHPFDNFTQTGRMWGAILGTDDIAPETVGLMMVAAKISRETHSPKRDNLVDMCGYAKAVEMVYERRAS